MALWIRNWDIGINSLVMWRMQRSVLLLLCFTVVVCILKIGDNILFNEDPLPCEVVVLFEDINVTQYFAEDHQNTAKKARPKHVEEPPPTATPETQTWFYQTSEQRLNPYRHHNLVNNKTVCGDIKDGAVLVLFAVMSAPQNLKQRTVIRRTWGQRREMDTGDQLQVLIRTMFFMGMSHNKDVVDLVLLEAGVNRDIVVDDFVDSYKNLTTKSRMLLHWITKYCNYKRKNVYIAKLDDDMIVNPTYLTKSIIAQPRERALFGAKIGGNKVSRSGRWGISRSQYPFDTLPVYLAGNLYVMTSDVAVMLYEKSVRFRLISMEDVYVTGVLARLAGVKPRGVKGFPIWLTSSPTHLCEMLKGDWVAVHRVDPLTTAKYWQKLTKGEICGI